MLHLLIEFKLIKIKTILIRNLKDKDYKKTHLGHYSH